MIRPPWLLMIACITGDSGLISRLSPPEEHRPHRLARSSRRAHRNRPLHPLERHQLPARVNHRHAQLDPHPVRRRNRSPDNPVCIPQR